MKLQEAMEKATNRTLSIVPETTAEADAALLVHWWNHGPTLLEALKAVVERVELLQGGDPCVNCRKIIAAAEEVEGI